MTLTEDLLNLDSYQFKMATQPIFLQQVGSLTITPRNLKAWMCQARLATGPYVKMIALMLSRLPLYTYQRFGRDSDASYTEEKANRNFKALTQALSQVNRKIDILTECLSREPYSGRYREVERQDNQTDYYYFVLNDIVSESGYSLGEDLVALWAMETVCVRAWEYARKIHDENSLQEQTIHTKTCSDLLTMGSTVLVDALASLVNELDLSGADRKKSLEATYKRILKNEAEFWLLLYQSEDDDD